QEMPSSGGAGPAVARKITPFIVGSILRGISRIEAHGYNLEIPPGTETHDPVHGSRQSVQHLRAQHGTLEVNQRKNDGFGTKILAKLHCVAVLISKGQVERDLLVEPLLDSDLIKDRRLTVGGAFPGLHAWRRLRAHCRA